MADLNSTLIRGNLRVTDKMYGDSSNLSVATTTKNGIMSATDKSNLDAIYGSLFTEDSDTVVNRLKDVLTVFSNFPEGTNVLEALNGKAPTSHASSETTYGIGTSSNYGHVKLATGDMNGASHADGVAVSKNHTHSQYQPAGNYLTTDGTHGNIITYPNINGTNTERPFLISRNGGNDSEVVKQWIDDANYHIDYTNDESASNIQWKIVNTDTENSASGTNASTHTMKLVATKDSLTLKLDDTAVSMNGHTHSYAGSSSAGGAANSVKESLTFSNSGNGDTSGTTYNGSTARTISTNSIGAVKKSGDTMTGALNFKGNTMNAVGNEFSFGSITGYDGVFAIKANSSSETGNVTSKLALIDKNSNNGTILTAQSRSDNGTNVNLTLPSKSGTLSLTSDIPDYQTTFAVIADFHRNINYNIQNGVPPIVSSGKDYKKFPTASEISEHPELYYNGMYPSYTDKYGHTYQTPNVVIKIGNNTEGYGDLGQNVSGPEYMYYMTGSYYLPVYNEKAQKQVLFLHAQDLTIWKPQWTVIDSSTGAGRMFLFYMGTLIDTLHDQTISGKKTFDVDKLVASKTMIIKDDTAAYNESPTLSTTSSIKFLDKNNDYVSVIRSAINSNSGGNSLNFLNKNKNGYQNGVAILTWYENNSNKAEFVPFNQDVTLGSMNGSSRIWSCVNAKQYVSRDTTTAISDTPSTASWNAKYTMLDKNNVLIGNVGTGIKSNNNAIELGVADKDGTYKNVRLVANGVAGAGHSYEFIPGSNGDINLGRNDYRWCHGYFDGTVHVGNRLEIEKHGDSSEGASISYDSTNKCLRISFH